MERLQMRQQGIRIQRLAQGTRTLMPHTCTLVTTRERQPPTSTTNDYVRRTRNSGRSPASGLGTTLQLVQIGQIPVAA